jgi:hypothetical protein
LLHLQCSSILVGNNYRCQRRQDFIKSKRPHLLSP